MTACEMNGHCLRSFSMLAGVRFLPPAVMMMSFLRPVILRKPSSSSSPTSPVSSQPSISVSAVASGLFQYSRKTFGPRMRISPSSSAILISTPGSGLPTVPNLKSSSVPTVPTPVVSVMPQPSITGTPAA